MAPPVAATHDITTPDCAVMIYGVLERFEAWDKTRTVRTTRHSDEAVFAELWDAGMITTGPDGAPTLLQRPIL